MSRAKLVKKSNTLFLLLFTGLAMLLSSYKNTSSGLMIYLELSKNSLVGDEILKST